MQGLRSLQTKFLYFCDGASNINALRAEASYLLWELDSEPTAVSFPKPDARHCLCCSQSPEQLLGFKPYLNDKHSLLQGSTALDTTHLTQQKSLHEDWCQWESVIIWKSRYVSIAVLVLEISILQRVNLFLALNFAGSFFFFFCPCNHTIRLKSRGVRFMHSCADMPSIGLYSNQISDPLQFFLFMTKQ